jgi:membrane-associated protease RseP (regulator of RpoE activity)
MFARTRLLSLAGVLSAATLIACAVRLSPAADPRPAAAAVPPTPAAPPHAPPEAINLRRTVTVEVVERTKDAVVGLFVSDVAKGSVAAKAGLQPGDVVVQFGRYRVANLNDLAALLHRLPDAGRVRIGVLRGEQVGYGTLELAAEPPRAQRG